MTEPDNPTQEDDSARNRAPDREQESGEHQEREAVTLKDPPHDYATHRDYVRRAKPAADQRSRLIRERALAAFANCMSREECVVINFRDLNAAELGRILAAEPMLVKPLMILCNVAERAVERDLGLKGLNSYHPRFHSDSAKALAGYLKPFLPERIELDSFCTIDRLMFLDKEIRKGKGRWELGVRTALSNAANRVHLGGVFRKRHFKVAGEDFELDAAYPESGPIRLAVDIKRIEARRDIHKRCDEIVNKASKFKAVHPDGHFIAFLYYPFSEEQINVAARLKSEDIDVVVFATEHPDSIANAAAIALKTRIA